MNERARAWLLHAREDRQQSGLAGPVGPDHRDQFAGVRVEADLVQRLALAIELAEAARPERRLAHGQACACRDVEAGLAHNSPPEEPPDGEEPPGGDRRSQGSSFR